MPCPLVTRKIPRTDEIDKLREIPGALTLSSIFQGLILKNDNHSREMFKKNIANPPRFS